MSKILESIKERRSIYAIDNNIKVSEADIEAIVKDSIKYVPSAFNSKSSRAIVLFKDEHEKFWNMLIEVMKGIVEGDAFENTKAKLNSFKAGYGTILYFEDQAIVKGLQESFPLYAHNFPIWSQQVSGMNQLVIWSALEEIGLGATVQHYNELIEEHVKKEWNVPEDYKLIAQMPFGNPLENAGEKDYVDLDMAVRVYR